ncbi:hypothetical protein LCGC14_2398120 [marine sediment metagenome]|uniref:Uncharacterized protein n=1 Tax=marine sediment metagenome TaxID=412755 RepID=A0A0F9BW80_9ZZZZ
MINHHVSVYTRAGVMAHVQSTNGDQWPPDVVETHAAGAVVPLVRIDVELEPTNAEVVAGANGRPAPRRAADLFAKELEVVAGKVRYRPGKGSGGAISNRAVAVLPA